MAQPLKGKTVSAKNKRRTLAISVGLLLFTTYLFLYRGGFHSIDEVSIFAVTESLVKFGRVNTDQVAWTQWTTTQAEAQGFFGRDGHVYSKKGLALSLVQAPLYWLALTLPGLGMLQTVSLLNALLTAATGLLIFMFIWRLSYSPGTAIIVALIYGLATIAFVYANYLFSEPLAGFLLLLAAYMLFTYRQEGGLRHVAIAGLAAGFAVVTRANNLFLLPIFGLYLLWIIYSFAQQGHRQGSLSAHLDRAQAQLSRSSFQAGITSNVSRTLNSDTVTLWLSPLATFIFTLAIPGAILVVYNVLRSGNPFQTGYDLSLFSPNILLGLYKLLFSPLRGLFIYSPILLLSLPGWWIFRKTYPAEAWLFAGLVGVTVGLFSAWSSGEGLSWGSRFLVPVVPFLTLLTAPIFGRNNTEIGNSKLKTQNHIPALRFTLYALLAASFLIQLLGAAINPWIFLAKIQTQFGGEFFLENTVALYDFRYSQMVGQLQSWSVQNSDLAWWQPWGFDGLAFALSLALVLLSGWLLWRHAQHVKVPGFSAERYAYLLTISLTLIITYFLLTRYYHTDRQFGLPDDPYIQALDLMTTLAQRDDQLVTVAQYHYHLPMNRFKAPLPITGLAQQSWPPPNTALALLEDATAGPNTWLVTNGLFPAAPDNAAEKWLSAHAFKASDEWLNDVRLIQYGNLQPNERRSLKIALSQQIELREVKLISSPQSGQVLPVEFIWQPLTQPEADYNLFLQLLTFEGVPVAQQDSPPLGGYAPTSTWSPGQAIIDRHGLALPADLPPGSYQLIAGLYDPVTGSRLTSETGRDFVDLGPITLSGQGDETPQ